MSGSETKKELAKGKVKAEETRQTEPEWASGLKQLYDSVVDEPLPDSFMDLLSQLDDETQRNETLDNETGKK